MLDGYVASTTILFYFLLAVSLSCSQWVCIHPHCCSQANQMDPDAMPVRVKRIIPNCVREHGALSLPIGFLFFVGPFGFRPGQGKNLFVTVSVNLWCFMKFALFVLYFWEFGSGRNRGLFRSNIMWGISLMVAVNSTFMMFKLYQRKNVLHLLEKI